MPETRDPKEACSACGMPRDAHWGSRPLAASRCTGFQPSNRIPVDREYLERLEQAVLTAEWWLADVKVAQQKDQRGERKREVYAAADAVRARQKGAAA